MRLTGGVCMDETRQSPEQILKQIEREEQSLNRGHLKIFFGYAAGVGKTYAMLKAAHSAKRQGIDVVAGYIEHHARPQRAPNWRSRFCWHPSTACAAARCWV